MPSPKKFTRFIDLPKKDRPLHPYDNYLEVPNFPVCIRDLDSDYLKNITLQFLNPIINSYNDNNHMFKLLRINTPFHETQITTTMHCISFDIESIINYKNQNYEIFIPVRIEQYSKENNLVVASIKVLSFKHKHIEQGTKKGMNSLWEFLDQLQLAVQRILNQIAYDANLYKSVLRNGTNKFIGPAEDLVRQYLGHN